MKRNFKLIFILYFIPCLSYGQYELFDDNDYPKNVINIDTSAKRKVLEVRTLIDSSFNQFVNEIEDDPKESFGYEVSYVLFNPLKCDTLNLMELEIPDFSGIKILSINGQEIKEENGYQNLHQYENILFGPTFKFDNKVQTIFLMIFGEYFMRISFSDDNFRFDFEEYYKEDEILSINGEDFTNSISWPLESFNINLEKPIQSGAKEIFGYGSLKTEKFYKKGQSFKNQILELVCYSDFYFKLKINE